MPASSDEDCRLKRRVEGAGETSCLMPARAAHHRVRSRYWLSVPDSIAQRWQANQVVVARYPTRGGAKATVACTVAPGRRQLWAPVRPENCYYTEGHCQRSASSNTSKCRSTYGAGYNVRMGHQGRAGGKETLRVSLLARLQLWGSRETSAPSKRY